MQLRRINMKSQPDRTECHLQKNGGKLEQPIGKIYSHRQSEKHR